MSSKLRHPSRRRSQQKDGAMSISRRSTVRGAVYDVRLRRPDGSVYKRTFRTKRDAEQYEASQRTERVHGTWIDPAGATMCFADWAQHWLDSDTAKTAMAKATDRSLLRSAILPTLGHRQLGSITPIEVQRLVASWNTTRKPRSVRRTYSVLAAAFNAAVAADVVARSPCRGVKLPVVEPAKARVLSAHDLRRLKEELPIQYRAMVTLGANLGLRFGEAAGLRVGRLDLEAGILHVERGGR
jgi:integrase